MKKGVRENKESGRYIREELCEKITAEKLCFGDCNWNLVKGYSPGGISVYEQWLGDKTGQRPTGYYKIEFPNKEAYFYRRGIGGDK